MFKEKFYRDQHGRFHDKHGRFTTVKLTQEELELLSENLYFSQDEDKPRTYHRTGAEIEVERDPNEIFATVTSYTLLGCIVITWICDIIGL